jgi:response regulator of citrate/malate metabolism
LRETDNCNDVPIFILSASPAIDAVEHSLEAGATAYLAKPLRLDTLEEIIEEYCKA